MFCLFTALACGKLYYSLNEEKTFVSYMKKQGFMFTGDEYHFRLGIFMANLRYVNDFNKGKHNFKLGMTKFMHFTPSEYKSLLGTRPSKSSSKPTSLSGYPVNDAQRGRKLSPAIAPVNDDTPHTDFSFADKGAVSDVKDQGMCGACWAFGATEGQESN